MKRLLTKWQKPLIVGLLVVFYGCVSAQETRHQRTDIKPVEPQASIAKAAPVVQPPAKPESIEIYQQKVEPLTTQECAQCHFSVFENIRDNGGKHQIHCRECHSTFHSLRPGKAWSDVVPHCATCHGEAHGPTFLECLSCHADPHAPISSLINLDVLAKGCDSCHVEQKKEVIEYKSAHTEVACSECHHTRHGHRPDCTECHSVPHTDFVDNSGCMGCHPVHSPREINYPATTGNQTCAGCHAEVTQHLTSSALKHSALQCVFCHADKHGYVPDCTKCHSQPHSKAMLARFENNCLTCHGEAHALVLPGH